MMMSGLTDEYSSMPFQTFPIVKPNIRTGVGRRHKRSWSAYKMGDQKKKTHRKMAKQSRRKNRK